MILNVHLVTTKIVVANLNTIVVDKFLIQSFFSVSHICLKFIYFKIKFLKFSNNL